jgi:transcription elongation GreA/GreB family factor
MLSVKEQIKNVLLGILNIREDEALKAIESARESRDSDTKSSAGDKHETARAMVQIELDKAEVQLGKILHQKEELMKLAIQKEYKKVEVGSLVYTNQENYFFSIAYGKLVINNEIFYVISLASPLGMALNNKAVGDRVQFQGREILVERVL